jgi:hypothetical protein
MATFERTQSIAQYANSNGLTGLELIKNPNTGKLFAKDSKGATYRVAEKVTQLTMDLQVSWFTPEDGEASFMIHTAGQTNVVSALSFGTPVAKEQPISAF